MQSTRSQQAEALSGGYNYDSTSIRLQFDRATTTRRLCCGLNKQVSVTEASRSGVRVTSL